MSIDTSEPPPRIRGKPFTKGNSGRPKGARNKTTLALEALLDGQAEAITKKVVERALAGDPVAMRLAFERILARRHDRPVSISLPEITSNKTGAEALAALVAAVGSGKVSPNDALTITQLINSTMKALDDKSVEERIEALEAVTREGRR